jgi:hypothetical protein
VLNARRNILTSIMKPGGKQGEVEWDYSRASVEDLLDRLAAANPNDETMRAIAADIGTGKWGDLTALRQAIARGTAGNYVLDQTPPTGNDDTFPHKFSIPGMFDLTREASKGLGLVDNARSFQAGRIPRLVESTTIEPARQILALTGTDGPQGDVPPDVPAGDSGRGFLMTRPENDPSSRSSETLEIAGIVEPRGRLMASEKAPRDDPQRNFSVCDWCLPRAELQRAMELSHWLKTANKQAIRIALGLYPFLGTAVACFLLSATAFFEEIVFI